MNSVLTVTSGSPSRPPEHDDQTLLAFFFPFEAACGVGFFFMLTRSGHIDSSHFELPLSRDLSQGRSGDGVYFARLTTLASSEPLKANMNWSVRRSEETGREQPLKWTAPFPLLTVYRVQSQNISVSQKVKFLTVRQERRMSSFKHRISE